MKPKTQERSEVERLRHQGLSLKKIQKLVPVSISSISLWTRNICLTEEQIALIQQNRTKNQSSKKGWRSTKCFDRRKSAQTCGAVLARQPNSLFKMGCMLYWGEGHKSRYSVVLSNMDVNLLRFFVKFLRDALEVQEKDIVLTCGFHKAEHKTEDELKQYWTTALNLFDAKWRKPYCVDSKSSSGQRSGKYPFGVCRISVYDYTKVQAIYGGIKELAQIKDKEMWLW